MGKMAVTGGAGFIGSNLAEWLLARGHEVIIIDDFSTGREENLSGWGDKVQQDIQVLTFDINNTDKLRQAFSGVEYVFHQAAIPSVPRSVDDPQSTNAANISGTLSVLVAARDSGVKRVVTASSSSVYGDDEQLPKREERLGKPLSPYALSKFVGEAYCRLFSSLYELETVSLRYFNVFGPRQDPKSEYAAVVPRFATRILSGIAPIIYGDGEQSRDFTYVSNVIDANWTAATHPNASGEAFNVGCGSQITLNELAKTIDRILNTSSKPIYEAPRKGDVRHSLASIEKAKNLMGYSPAVSLEEGLKKVIAWYRDHTEVFGDTAQQD